MIRVRVRGDIFAGEGGGRECGRQLASLPVFGCHDGMTMGLIARGLDITMTIDSVYTSTVTDSSIASGQAGVSFSR